MKLASGICTKQIKKEQRILYPYNSEDSALYVHEWNIDRIQTLIQEGASKVVCTSKGVLGTLEKRSD